jgi:hypothetical protein
MNSEQQFFPSLCRLHLLEIRVEKFEEPADEFVDPYVVNEEFGERTHAITLTYRIDPGVISSI